MDRLLTAGRLSGPLALILLAVAVGALGGLAATTLPPFVAAAALVGLLGGVLMLAYPRLGLLGSIGVACLLPFGVIPFRLGLTVTLLEAVLALLLVVWAAGLLGGRGERLQGTALDLPLLGFIGLSVFSLALGWRQGLDSETLHNYVKFLLAVSLFFTATNLLRTRGQLEQVVVALILAGTAAAGLGLLLYLAGPARAERLLQALAPLGYPTMQVLRYIEDNPDLPLRLTSTSVDPNSFGGLLALLVTLLASQLLSPAPLLKRPVTFGALAVCTPALLLTYGRGAWLGAAVGLLFLAVFADRRLLLPLAGGGIAVVLLGLGGGFASRLAAGFQLQDQATIMRLSEYRNAVEIIQQYPLFGIGYGTAPSIDLFPGVSSIYLTIGQQMGLLGLAAFLLLIGIYYLQVFRALPRLRDPGLRALLVGLAGMMLAALAVGVLDHYFANIRFPHMVALFWLVAALTLTVIRIDGTPSRPARAAPPHPLKKRRGRG